MGNLDYQKGVSKAKQYAKYLHTREVEKGKEDPFIYDLSERARKGNLTPKERDLLEGYSNELLKYAAKSGDTLLALGSVRDFEYLGLNPAKSKFVKKAVNMTMARSFESGQKDNHSYRELMKFVRESNHSANILERKLGGIMSIVGVVGLLFFLSPGLTGNVVENLSATSLKGVGTISFLIALVGLYFLKKDN